MTITLTGISKVFGDFTAVHPLDLTIPEGSFFALLGASGCGKTTTLRMIAGLEEPTGGSIRLGDEDITGLPPHKRPVNTVFQNYALFPHLDVSENVAFGLRRRGITSVRKQVEEMLELVELGQLAKRKPRQLSGGQQQRVALARALINRPQVLLLDEPLGALDLKLRRQMQLELKRIQTEVGITFVHVTHDQEEAMTMADTVAVMNAGRVEQLGAPDELYERPRSTFVANFLGTSNLIEAEITETEGEYLLLKAVGTDTALRLPAERCAVEDPQAGGKVLVGVRPEKITLAHAEDADTGSGKGSADNRLSGRIRDAGYLGVSMQYVVDTPVCPEFSVYEQNVERDARLAPGAEVVMRWRPAHTFALDAAQDADAGTLEDSL
ncbi:spermidine/putrescine ABC transporter ATP-binding protein [Streptomyces abyssalis]|uniref:Spermidine/putrescine import ATP-binding protein PotA n=1 Tax=Streptomyces abyssalis TaxID=933944 RepID=A0A1E7JHE7_9ACTN|nr:ABC transporter ATP-binding protein [Streptomyces abyssalis]OEU85914.1 spermidine/putrescine ABC transporter ATP-binding protein [Streptomyces abyssalis]OEU92619.1 spermidine/putrescine ABC transporter ATP-binding protein [Streptomyces abyssalis]